jgi:hypothetical protein
MQPGTQPVYNPVKHAWSAKTFVPNCTFVQSFQRLCNRHTEGVTAHASAMSVFALLGLEASGCRVCTAFA